MKKNEKDPNPLVPSAQEMQDLSFELAKMHLFRLRERARSQEGLSPHEGNAICNYLKTFSQLNKLEKELDEKAAKEVSKLTDEELKAELDKLLKGEQDAD